VSKRFDCSYEIYLVLTFATMSDAHFVAVALPTTDGAAGVEHFGMTGTDVTRTDIGAGEPTASAAPESLRDSSGWCGWVHGRVSSSCLW
jgi:hypothetical protein